MSLFATARLATLATAAFFSAAVLASPCSAPADFVKGNGATRAPLLRPFVVSGLAATALHQRDNERWLELAVDKADTVHKALAGRADAARVLETNGVVLLACRSLAGGDSRIAQQSVLPLATPLW